MCREFLPYRSAEQGSALILALLVAALVASLGMEYSGRFLLNATRAENYAAAAQAQRYIAGAERLAVLLLQQDLAASSIDHAGEIWAQPVPPFAAERGQIQIRIEDAQSRFNINSLLAKSENLQDLGLEPGTRFTVYQKQFIRLLQSFEQYPVNQQDAVFLTEAIIDWLDADDEPTGFGGAESLFYSGEQPAYRPANRPLASVSELRLIRHMNEGLYQLLQPLLVAVPQVTSLNVNTIRPELLRAINHPASLDPLDGSIALDLMAMRAAEPFQSTLDFLAVPVLQELLGTSQDTAGLAVKSDFFILHSRADSGPLSRFAESYLQRSSDGRVALIKRIPGSFQWQ